MASSDFGRMLSVGAIRFEDRFCGSRKGGTGGGGGGGGGGGWDRGGWVVAPLWLTVHGGGCSCL